MIELEYPHPSQIRPIPQLSPLAEGFEAGLMSADISGAPNNDDTSQIEIAIADAIANYCLIGLDPRAIIKRLIDHL